MLFHTPVFVHQEAFSWSAFIAEPGTTISLEFAEHLSNINFEYWFQSLQELNTKLCKPMQE